MNLWGTNLICLIYFVQASAYAASGSFLAIKCVFGVQIWFVLFVFEKVTTEKKASNGSLEVGSWQGFITHYYYEPLVWFVENAAVGILVNNLGQCKQTEKGATGQRPAHTGPRPEPYNRLLSKYCRSMSVLRYVQFYSS